MRIILLGAPGSGKGTQAKLLEQKYHAKHLCTGDLLRAELAKGTELGKKVVSFLKAGKLAPDELVIKFMKSEILKHKNFVLDGFPRNLKQAKSLEEIPIDLVINIDVEEDVLVRRLSGRRLCRKCNAIYHLETKPPTCQGICDHCGGKLFQRNDDREEVIRKRLEVYREETLPLIRYYKERDKLKTIAGNKVVGEIFKELKTLLTPFR